MAVDRKTTVAKSAGFCFGVERTVNQVYEQIGALRSKKTSGPIYIYSPIIHNEEVVRDLLDKDVMVLKAENELRTLPKNQRTVIVRSHGINGCMYEILKERSVVVVDATCSFMKKIHRIMVERSTAGEAIVTIENPDHPEVEGIKG